MAQKSNPIILRLLKTNRHFDGCWFNNSNYVYLLMRDFKIIDYINGILKTMNVSSARFLIQNLHNKQKINVFFCNLQKTRNHINRTLKQASSISPTKTRKLNVHRTLLYKNDDRLTSTEFGNPILRTKRLGDVAFDLPSKTLETHLQQLKLDKKTNTFFTHNKIFSFLNKHFITSIKQGDKYRKLLLAHKGVYSQNGTLRPIADLKIYDVISEKQNIGTTKSKHSVLDAHISESYTIEKLQLTLLRYFIIKYYLLNPSNAFLHNKLDYLSESTTESFFARYKSCSDSENASAFAPTTVVLNVASNQVFKSHNREFNIKCLLKTRFDFMFSKQHEIFPIIKHFILQNQKKKIFFSFLKHQKQYYIINKVFYKESIRFQSKNILNNLSKFIIPDSIKYTLATNTETSNELSGNAEYKEKLALNNLSKTQAKTDGVSPMWYNETKTLNKAPQSKSTPGKASVFFPLHTVRECASLLAQPTRLVQTLYFLDSSNISRLHSKFSTFSKSLSFSNYMEHSCLPVYYGLKNDNTKVKNLAFCNKLIYNCNYTFNVLTEKAKRPCLNTVNKDSLDFYPIKNAHKNFINQSHLDIYTSKFAIIACLNKQYLYRTYNDYCNVFVIDSILNEKVTKMKQSIQNPTNAVNSPRTQQYNYNKKTIDKTYTCSLTNGFKQNTKKNEVYERRETVVSNNAPVTSLSKAVASCEATSLTLGLLAHNGKREKSPVTFAEAKTKKQRPFFPVQSTQTTVFNKFVETWQNPKLKLLIPSSVYKQHIECVIQKNFLSPNPINLHFFTSCNIFQNATYLMDIFIYYLEKKQPFFKLKNMVLKQLTELKPLIVKGVLVQCSGRVAMKSKKAQKAKIQTFKYGETGLHVFNSKLDFKSSKALTSFGTIGIKIWICYF